MKSWYVLIVSVVICLCVAAQADTVTYNLYVKNTTDIIGSVAPGGSIDLWVVMVTDPADSVVNVGYNVLLPVDNWELTSRDMYTYGWFEADGLWDSSVPTAPDCPATVTDALYLFTPTDPDFHTDTTRRDFTGVNGTVTVEDFQLTIPGSTALGDYTISLLNPFAHDLIGDPIDANAGGDFTLSVIPEPATLLLTLSGLAAFGVAFKRRRQL